MRFASATRASPNCANALGSLSIGWEFVPENLTPFLDSLFMITIRGSGRVPRLIRLIAGRHEPLQDFSTRSPIEIQVVVDDGAVLEHERRGEGAGRLKKPVYFPRV